MKVFVFSLTALLATAGALLTAWDVVDPLMLALHVGAWSLVSFCIAILVILQWDGKL